MNEVKSQFLRLSKSDFVKAFWIFLSSSIVSIVGDAILQAINSGNYSLSGIHWNEILAAIAVSTIG